MNTHPVFAHEVGLLAGLGLDRARPAVAIGAQRCDAEGWLIGGLERSMAVADKATVLADHASDVLVLPTDPGTIASCEEVRALCDARLRELGVDVRPDPDRHPLDDAAARTMEDLILMSRHVDGEGVVFCLRAASVCAPSGWRVVDRVGQNMTTLHAEVPGFPAVARRVDAFLAGLRRTVERHNWFLYRSPERFQPVARRPTCAEVLACGGAGLASMWLRTERQTLTPLLTGDLLFTVAVRQVPISAVFGSPHWREALAGWCRSADPLERDRRIGGEDVCRAVADVLVGDGCGGRG